MFSLAALPGYVGIAIVVIAMINWLRSKEGKPPLLFMVSAPVVLIVMLNPITGAPFHNLVRSMFLPSPSSPDPQYFRGTMTMDGLVKGADRTIFAQNIAAMAPANRKIVVDYFNKDQTIGLHIINPGSDVKTRCDAAGKNCVVSHLVGFRRGDRRTRFIGADEISFLNDIRAGRPVLRHVDMYSGRSP